MYSTARKIYNDMKHKLQHGHWGVLPPERELCRHYNAGRCAVRSALRELEKEQLLINDRSSRRRIAAGYPGRLKKVLILRTREPLFYDSTEALSLMNEISSAVRQLGGEPVFFFSLDENPLKMLIDTYNHAEYSGIICVEDCVESALGDHYLRLLARGIPVVVANFESYYTQLETNLPSTRIDFRDIGRLGGRALLQAGRKRLGLISPERSFTREIIAGLRGAMAEEELVFDPELFFRENYYSRHHDDQSECARLMRILSSPDRPDGFIIFRHLRIRQLLQCCAQLNLRIPEDIMLVVYDCPNLCDCDINMLFLPEPVKELGWEAARLLSEWESAGKPPENTICQLSMPVPAASYIQKLRLLHK